MLALVSHWAAGSGGLDRYDDECMVATCRPSQNCSMSTSMSRLCYAPRCFLSLSAYIELCVLSEQAYNIPCISGFGTRSKIRDLLCDRTALVCEP